MRFRFALTAVLLLTGVQAFAQDLNTDKGKLSYAMGWNLGSEIKNRSTEIDVEALIQAIRDTTSDADPQVTVEEMRTLLAAHQEKLRKEALENLQRLAQENQVKSEEFLEQNRNKTGIVVLPSGVQYRIIEEGDGSRPGLDSRVQVHYRSSKVDGIEMDSSFARGVPEEFVVNAVLQGWQEVLPLMKTGSTWQIFVPPELAFGQRGNPPAVGPNEALMFDLKLIEIVE